MTDRPFWRTKRLEDMTSSEWEALCDGCGKCCLLKAEDEDTGEVLYTEVACRLLDLESCRCTDYRHRKRHVPDCVQLTPHGVRTIPWLPATCAYRLVDEGHDLYWWHHLISSDPETVHLAGISVKGRALPEGDVGDPLSHLAAWPAEGAAPEADGT